VHAAGRNGVLVLIYEPAGGGDDAAASTSGTGQASGQAAATAATAGQSTGAGAATGQAASVASTVFSIAGSGNLEAVGQLAPKEAAAFLTGAGAASGGGASIAAALAFSAGLGVVDAEGASEQAGGFVDAAFSMAGSVEVSVVAASIARAEAAAVGVGVAEAEAASLASSAAMAEGAGVADGVGATGDEPVEEPSQPEQDLGGGAGALHPDLAAPKKRRKPRIIRQGEADGQSVADQAESDFRTLWEAVRIRDNPKRLEAVAKKRAAMMADLERATLIRKAS
jgi:hypothetical protein